MSDIESSDDFSKFEEDDDDNIRPIDVGAETAQNPVPSDVHHPAQGPQAGNPPPQGNATPKPLADQQGLSPERKAELKSNTFDNEINYLLKGKQIDITDKVPSLREIYVGAGWEQRAMEENKVDVDLCCFLLNKDEETRNDEDFVFYNNYSTCDGAVRHRGDSRTGAGEGDDESMLFDLRAIPFDVLKIVFVLAVYNEIGDERHFGLVRDMFVRVVNAEDDEEILRMALPDSDLPGMSAVRTISLIREGPRWVADGVCEFTEGGLGEIAKEYGIILKEETG